MLKRSRIIANAALVAMVLGGELGQTLAAEEQRFEVASIKAIRPTLVDTISALQQRDIARAKASFDAYDSGWNGIEVYINVRSRDMYQLLELEFQPRIIKALDQPAPDLAAVAKDVEAMLAKFDETVGMIERAPALSPVYDDVARLRIVRAHLREVNPALKVGNIAKAKKSFEAFEDEWFNIEDFVRGRSLDAYVAIESGMVDIERVLLTPDKPDATAVAALVGKVMTEYSSVVTELQKEARARP
jgi:high-affinity iron transporter